MGTKTTTLVFVSGQHGSADQDPEEIAELLWGKPVTDPHTGQLVAPTEEHACHNGYATLRKGDGHVFVNPAAVAYVVAG
jgi:hypothetical protein